jgi:alpha-L-fucosidase 2
LQRKLWYTTPPDAWLDGLPIGNGRLAAMVTGGKERDTLSLNHEWLWRGKNRDRDNKPVSKEHLDEIRNLLQEGDFFHATVLTNAYYAGIGGISGIKGRVDAYQPAGDLIFDFTDSPEYEGRSLDISTGVATVQRSGIDSTFFVSGKVNNIVCHWTSQEKFGGVLSFVRQEDDCIEEWIPAPQELTYKCAITGGISFTVKITVQTDGTVTPRNGKELFLQGASKVTAFVNIAVEVENSSSDFLKFPPPLDLSYDEILFEHSKEFSTAMNRFDLQIDAPEVDLPTDERIRRLRQGENDTALHMLYFHYGRYLLISSSIHGELPANLQGKWNHDIKPPWDSDYHFDINLQMNYWLAEPCNMHDCVEALIQYIERFVPHGKKAAADLYGARGVYLPLQTDAWGLSTPESFGWAAWIGAAPWIARHFWMHYVYGGDLEFLKTRAYPFFKEVALFYEDYLVRDKAGVWQIMPSQSPENKFVGSGDFPSSIGISSAMDVELAYDALGYAVQSAQILAIDEENAKIWSNLRENLPKLQAGSDGRLLEWDIERVEVEPGHRHLSHLYGLFPSDIINPIESKDTYDAAVKSLEYRMSVGGGHTGWSRAWVACLFARTGKGEQVYRHISALISDFATVSLLDLHPPQIFQIDGNLGAVAGIVEGIAQFWAGKLHLLRALPNAYETGSISGLKTPGGHTVSFAWEKGKLKQCEVIIGYSKELVIRTSRDIVVKGQVGQQISIDLSD